MYRGVNLLGFSFTSALFSVDLAAACSSVVDSTGSYSAGRAGSQYQTQPPHLTWESHSLHVPNCMLCACGPCVGVRRAIALICDTK